MGYFRSQIVHFKFGVDPSTRTLPLGSTSSLWTSRNYQGWKHCIPPPRILTPRFPTSVASPRKTGTAVQLYALQSVANNIAFHILQNISTSLTYFYHTVLLKFEKWPILRGRTVALTSQPPHLKHILALYSFFVNFIPVCFVPNCQRSSLPLSRLLKSNWYAYFITGDAFLSFWGLLLACLFTRGIHHRSQHMLGNSDWSEVKAV